MTEATGEINSSVPPVEIKYGNRVGKRDPVNTEWKTRRGDWGGLYKEPAPLSTLGKWAYRMFNRMRGPYLRRQGFSSEEIDMSIKKDKQA